MRKADSRRGRALRRAALAAAAGLLAGCGGLDWMTPEAPSWVAVRGYRSVQPPRQPVRRVLVLPFKVGDALPEHADKLRAALAQALRDSCGFDVVAPAEIELPRSTRDEIANGGGRDSAGLIRLHREWDADAALFGRLAFGRAHGEPAVGVELELIDARDGARLWSAKDTVDARDPTTRASLLAWRKHETGHDEDPVSATQIPFDSFARFVASSFVRTLFPAQETAPARPLAATNPEKPAQARN
ncbi:MAG TPA: hypothetical protein VFG37_11610 [Planctomycetota bacterium]|jgi:hypothetical protein|nr:hypothetical protein [Planctomycetota bacterium]